MSANIYMVEDLELPIPGFVKLSMQLIEKDWNFSNQILTMKTSDTLFNLIRKIEKTHPKVKNIQIYYPDLQTQCLIIDQKLGDLIKNQGVQNEQDARTYNFYYKFDSAIDNPLLLMFNDYAPYVNQPN